MVMMLRMTLVRMTPAMATATTMILGALSLCSAGASRSCILNEPTPWRSSDLLTWTPRLRTASTNRPRRPGAPWRRPCRASTLRTPARRLGRGRRSRAWALA
eukprot:2752107-Pyramimonas_sp.AAC.1